MDQRWLDLIARVSREGFALVVWRFPSAPRRPVKLFVLSPAPGTDLHVLKERVGSFLDREQHRQSAWPSDSEREGDGGWDGDISELT